MMFNFVKTYPAHLEKRTLPKLKLPNYKHGIGFFTSILSLYRHMDLANFEIGLP